MANQRKLVAAIVLLGVVILGGNAWVRHQRHPAQPAGGPADSVDLSFAAEQLRTVPPGMLRYEQTGQIQVDLAHPVALAVGPEDRLYVAGVGGIRAFDPLPGLRIETSADATCIAVDADGKIYAGFTDHLEVFDDQGKRLAVWKSPAEKTYLTSIALGQDELYLADCANRVIWRCDRTGKVLGKIGQKDPARDVPGFVVPSPHFDVAIGPDGLIRVADTGRHQIEAYTPAGDLEFAWGRSGGNVGEFCGCCNPSNFAILSDGRFVTAEKGLPTVTIFRPDGSTATRGQVDCVVAGPQQMVNAAGKYADIAEDQVPDVAIDSRGRILVLDSYIRAVRIFVNRPTTQPTTEASHGR